MQARLEDVLENFLQKHLQDVFKTSWKIKNCYTEDVLENKKCLLGCSFQKKMLSNFLTCALIYSLTKYVPEDGFKDSRDLKIWRSLLVRKLKHVELSRFWTKRYTKYNFWRIYEIFNITNSKYLDCQVWFQ